MDDEKEECFKDGDEDDADEEESEGSSMSSTFCTLERDFTKVIQEMKGNEALAHFEADYKTLFESLYKSHKSEAELSNKCISLTEEIVHYTNKINELEKQVINGVTELENLKQEIEDTKNLADAAHTREQIAEETIDNLRINISKLNQEIDRKNKLLSAQDEAPMSKQKENLMQERERLTGEIDAFKQRLKNMSVYTEELERKSTEADHRLNEMQEALDVQLNENSKERRARERAEAETNHLRVELAARNSDFETVNALLKTTSNNAQQLQNEIKEDKSTIEKMQKEMNKLMVKIMNLQADLSNANIEMEKVEMEVEDKNKELKTMKLELNRMKEESIKQKNEKDFVEKKLIKIEIERNKLELENKQLLTNIKNADYNVTVIHKQLSDQGQQVELLTREKNVLARSKESLNDQIKRLNHEIVILEQAKQKIEQELDDQTHICSETKLQLQNTEKERDRSILKVQDLNDKVEEYISEVKLKQVEIFDYKKRLTQAETKYRQQQNILETLRAERNTYSKNVVLAQDEIQDLKNKIKLTSHQIEHLKEECANKEANIIKQEFLMNKIEKEKEAVKSELQTARNEIIDLRRECEAMKQEEKLLRKTIQQVEDDLNQRKKDIENVMNERDMLGTQLVRRNDELSLQYNRIKILNTTLQRGEVEYNQRLEDIRLLKLEVKKLRTEKTLLAKNLANISDMRQEILHLNRDLTKERLKVMALEEEVQTPLNIHRWRKLEGSDPSRFELVEKVQLLQKRILKQSSKLIDKEKKIKDVEKLYTNLREVMSTQPGPNAAISLNKAQDALRKRGHKMKCLVSELNMYEVQVNEYKIDLEQMNREMYDIKQKYYIQKRKLQSAEAKSKSVETMLPPVLVTSRQKFCGGGFNMTCPPICNENSNARRSI